MATLFVKIVEKQFAEFAHAVCLFAFSKIIDVHKLVTILEKISLEL